MNSETPVPQFDFLDADFDAMREPARPVNVFDLSGFPRWETVSSRVLAYFFDPRDSRHGFGTVFADALLQQLKGAVVFSHDGAAASHEFDPDGALRSDSWSVETEAVTDDGKRIDILLKNDALGLAIAIENKLDAGVQNPFRSYTRSLQKEYDQVLTVLLSPTRRDLERLGKNRAWLSVATTYDELFDRVMDALPHVAQGADPRSLDLLKQFMENTSEREQRMDLEAEAGVLEPFWDATIGPGRDLGPFFEALTRVNRILLRRAQTLQPRIEEELVARGLFKDKWLVSGIDRSFGRREGRVAIVYVAFELVDGNCIELLVGQLPGREIRGFGVKAYPDRRRASKMYPDYLHVPMASTWRDPDDDVIDEFFDFVDRLQRDHPRAS